MNISVLLIKNNINYPFEAIVGFTDLHLKDMLNLDDLIDLLEFDASEFDAVLFEMECYDTFEKATLDRISKKWNKPALVIITRAKNEEKVKELTDNYLLVEQLTPILLEKSVLLAIEKKKVDDLNWKLQNYEQLIEEDIEKEANLTIENYSYLEEYDDIIDLNPKTEFFNQYDSDESELKWLEILLNAVPCGIIILDCRESHEFFVNRELLHMFGNYNLDEFNIEKNLIKINNINALNLYSPNGEKIADEEFPSIKSIISGEDIENLEQVIKYDEYTDKTVMINSSPVFDKSGNIIASITAISDVSKLKNTERDLINTIKAKNIISEEFNDRILNILQTMTNLLCVNEELDQPEQYNKFYLNENKINKVVGLSFIQNIHEQLLYYEDVKQVDFNEYVQEICSKLLHIYNAESLVDLKIEGHAPMNLDIILPCGLIINDILNYRLKSFTKSAKINLMIESKSQDGRITIEIADNGPRPKVPVVKNSDDLKLTHALLEQLSGIIRIETNNQQTSFFIEILYLDINDILS
ncbi:histidine kinase dimerization/phosphoacceptor domain -containing protein [Methanobacterium sp.]|jgi:two-component sensor histidine kinase/PAS domain-containing protein|uniref:histidine kinase dimerization/phosphoacceptor domain -containing protein n=1 Tax=Methanobacterium sp. TaxID=2164 RepID=UPI0031586DE4